MKTKLRISANDLLQSLAVVGPAVGQNAIIPITESVLLTNQFVAACDLGMSIKKTHQFESAEPFSTVINYSELKAICSNSKGGDIEIEQTVKTEKKGDDDVTVYKIKITSGKDVYRTEGDSVSNWPFMSEGESEPMALEIESSIINEMHLASFSVGADALRPSLNNVVLVDYGDGLCIVGCDSNIVYMFETGIKTGFKIHVPLSFVKAVAGLEKATMYVNEKNIRISTDDIDIMTVLVEGKVTDFRVIKPADITPNIKLNRNALMKGINKTLAFKNKGFDPVLLTFLEGSISITKVGDGLNREIVAYCDAEHSVTEGSLIKLNANLFLKLLNSIQADEISIQYTVPNKLLVITTDTPGFWAGANPLFI